MALYNKITQYKNSTAYKTLLHQKAIQQKCQNILVLHDHLHSLLSNR